MITYIVKLQDQYYDIEEVEVLDMEDAEDLYNHYKDDDHYMRVEIIAYAYTPGIEKRQAYIDVLKPEDESSYKYDVQIAYSPDGGENFYYAGIGRKCKTQEEVEAYVTEKLNEGRKAS